MRPHKSDPAVFRLKDNLAAIIRQLNLNSEVELRILAGKPLENIQEAQKSEFLIHLRYNGISRKGEKTQSVATLNSPLFPCALATLRETFHFQATSSSHKAM